MEAVIGLLFLLLLLCILLLPVFILFGLVGLAFQSIWAAALFALKYLSPVGVIGFITAFVRGKKRYYEFIDYLKFIGGFMAAGLVVMVIIVSVTVTPELPSGEDVLSVTVSFGDGERAETEENDEVNYRIGDACDSLNRMEYKRTLKEFINEEDESVDINVTFSCEDGKELKYIFYSNKQMAVDDGGFLEYYRVADEEDKLPYDSLKDVIYDAENERATEPWRPFADEFFDSIYCDEEGYINFTVPSEAPNENYGLRINLEGVNGYTGGEFKPERFEVFADEQKSGSWEAGATYRFPISTIVYSRFEFAVSAKGIRAITFDALPLLPPKNVHRLK